MKNDYVIENDIVKIKIKWKTNFYECIIDLDDLEKIKSFEGTWYGHSNKKEIGSVYVFNWNKGDRVRIHRVISNCPKGLDVDHINGDTLDNRKSNLRNVNRQQNTVNMHRNKRNTSGTIGVYPYKRDNKWVAKINSTYLGLFKEKEEAVKAVEKYKKEVLNL